MSSKDKDGQATVIESTIAPLPSPSAGSASPSSSLAALFRYILPALDHIVRSSSNDPIRAPPVAIEYHMAIHTNCYNYFTAQVDRKKTVDSGMDLYLELDKYFANVVRELLLEAPKDDTTLIHYLVPCFQRYNAGAQSTHRLLNYINRHYVKCAVDEDKGWLRLTDLLDVVAKTIKEGDTREMILKRLKDRRMEELKTWGYVEGGSAELIAQAEASAEAASSLDRVVPISSLAMRRFRTEFIEPLLKVPKIKVMGKKKRPSPMGGDQGRLARAVKALLETEGRPGEVEKWRSVANLAIMLKTIGISAHHPLRQTLDKLVIVT